MKARWTRGDFEGEVEMERAPVRRGGVSPFNRELQEKN
jgi:hypothetical protein